MKAVEYWNKYEKRFFPAANFTMLITMEKADAAIKDLLVEFSKETIKICETRHATRDEAAKAVVREQNLKWNALCRVFEKRSPVCPIKHNGFLKFWKERINTAL